MLGVQNSYVDVMLFAAMGAVATTEYIRRFTSEATLDHIWFGQYVDKAKQWRIKIQSPVIRAANAETSCNEIDEEGEWCDELLNWQKLVEVANITKNQNTVEDEQQALVQHGKCLVCLKPCVFECATCGYAYCNADSYLFSHIQDLGHQVFRFIESDLVLRCAKCHMSDIRRLKYEKGEKVQGRILCDNHARLESIYLILSQ